MEFESIDDLYKFLHEDLERALVEDVAPQVKMLEQEVIDEVVYDVYEPKYYKRRYDYKGLSDLRSMEESIEVSGDEIVLSIENVTETVNKFEGRTLDDIIENGVKKGGDEIPPYAKPRRFTEETQRRVDNSNLVENILRDRLDYIE